VTGRSHQITAEPGFSRSRANHRFGNQQWALIGSQEFGNSGKQAIARLQTPDPA
jgi:hypothetical protein